MGMSSGGEEHGAMSEINVTPFVDVMLVLLIIFMVTAPMMTQGVNVEVPKTEGASLEYDEKQLTLSVTEQGVFFINETELTLDLLKEKLNALNKVNPDQSIYLWADAAVPYQHVAEAMTACTQAGFTRINMVTEPAPN